MTPSNPSSRCRRASARAVNVTGCAALLVLSVAGCANDFQHTTPLVPGPSGAIAAAPLDHQRIAVLAGSPETKGVFIVDLARGAVERSFGVTKEATGIAAESGNGPLLISVGGVSPSKHAFGAVELWSLAGQKTKVVPMPSEAHGITSVALGNAYVLVGDGPARAAIKLSVPALHVAKPIPLDAKAKTLAQCVFGEEPYLIYSGGLQNTIVVRALDSGQTMRSSVVADAPTCVGGHQAVFALAHSFAAASVVALTMPNLLQQTQFPASSDAIQLYESGDHHLIALNATPRFSNIQTFTDDQFPKQAK